jgi:L-alanine-DL-glutamate epimerase-like enolase superfamily enzyme
LQPAIIRVIADEMAPKLIGRRVMAIEQAWDLTRASTEPFQRDRRIALRDAVVKLAGLPLRVLWGNSLTEVPVVVLGGY